MKNILLYTALCVTITSCATAIEENVERIPVNLGSTSNQKGFIKEIEMIPLETSNEILIDRIKEIISIPEDSSFIIVDKRNLISIFGENGRFYANSQKIKGDAPHQYNSIVDVSYNPYTQSIEVLTINGEIKSYDQQFNFKERKRISLEEEHIPGQFMALDSTSYIVAPTINQNENLFFVNMQNKDSQIAYYGNMIANTNMDVNSFYNRDKKQYFVPKGINYYFYEINTEEKKLHPTVYLDFGEEQINQEELPGDVHFGRFKGDETGLANFLSEMHKRDEYLASSDYYLPIIKFFNNKYVYIHAIKKRKPYNYIYNRTTKEAFVQQGNVPVSMRFCLGINDNVLYTYINPYEIEKYYDADLITPESKERIAKVQEEDNIIIVKYHLK